MAVQSALFPKTPEVPMNRLPDLFKQPFDFFIDSHMRYGDLYVLNLGVGKAIMLNHPRHVQHILRDHTRRYYKGGPLWESVRDIMGNGLAVSEGDFWLRQRRMMQPQFNHQSLAGLTTLMVDAIDDSLNSWEHTPSPIDISPLMSRITMKIILRTIFGSSMSNAEAEAIEKDVVFMLQYVMLNMLVQKVPPWIPMPGRKRFHNIVRTIDGLLYDKLAAPREEDDQTIDLLSMLAMQVDDETDERMTDKQLRDEAMTFFIAGADTTAWAATWAFDYLTHYPEVAATLRKEVDTICGSHPPTFEDLHRLTYTRMVVQETTRLRPPAWWVPRTTVEDDEIDGFFIPKDMMIIPNLFTIHRHPDIWDNPHEFDPERFAPGKFSPRHRLAWAPFSTGPRQCIGKEFAIMEAQLILAMVSQRFNLRAGSPHCATAKFATTHQPKGGVMIQISKRPTLHRVASQSLSILH